MLTDGIFILVIKMKNWFYKFVYMNRKCGILELIYLIIEIFSNVYSNFEVKITLRQCYDLHAIV